MRSLLFVELYLTVTDVEYAIPTDSLGTAVRVILSLTFNECCSDTETKAFISSTLAVI